MLPVLAGIICLISGCGSSGGTRMPVTEFQAEAYGGELWKGTLYAEDLCVAGDDVSLTGYEGDGSLSGAGLFDLDNSRVLYAADIHERIYPASVTKIMTALLVLESGRTDDTFKISSTAAAASFPADAQVLGLQEGDVWTVQDLLYGLLLYSGNDCAAALAEYVSGSEEAFVAQMNERAESLMASGTHFTNPHGLHDDEHYTTVYDLYLIFQSCIKNEKFREIIQTSSYTAHYTAADGSKQETVFQPTNLYAKGSVELPANAVILGGKTGTTYEAGYCLILLEEDASGHPYISVVMGAGSKPELYENMTALIQAIPPV